MTRQRMIDRLRTARAGIADSSTGIVPLNRGEVDELVRLLVYGEDSDHDTIQALRREVIALQHRETILKRQVRIAAGLLSTTEGYSHKHPQAALERIELAEEETRP